MSHDSQTGSTPGVDGKGGGVVFLKILNRRRRSMNSNLTFTSCYSPAHLSSKGYVGVGWANVVRLDFKGF